MIVKMHVCIGMVILNTSVEEQSKLLISTGVVGTLNSGATAPIQIAIILTCGALAPYQIAQCYGASILNAPSSGAPNFQATLTTMGTFQAGDQISVQILNNTGVAVYIYAGSFTYLSITPVNE